MAGDGWRRTERGLQDLPGPARGLKAVRRGGGEGGHGVGEHQCRCRMPDHAAVEGDQQQPQAREQGPGEVLRDLPRAPMQRVLCVLCAPRVVRVGARGECVRNNVRVVLRV